MSCKFGEVKFFELFKNILFVKFKGNNSNFHVHFVNNKLIRRFFVVFTLCNHNKRTIHLEDQKLS